MVAQRPAVRQDMCGKHSQRRINEDFLMLQVDLADHKKAQRLADAQLPGTQAKDPPPGADGVRAPFHLAVAHPQPARWIRCNRGYSTVDELGPQNRQRVLLRRLICSSSSSPTCMAAKRSLRRPRTRKAICRAHMKADQDHSAKSDRGHHRHRRKEPQVPDKSRLERRGMAASVELR